ncbi:MAG: prepilin-type N-terminal cleavage/methylation domain-containing protein [Candidatus Saccharimonadales bacterium]
MTSSSQTYSSESGFTAIELLITLFIAAVFIISGYQLYSAVMSDGTSARNQAKAGNIAYEYLNNYATAVPGTCSVNTDSPTPPTDSGVPNISITVNTTCPYGDGATLSRIEVIVNYGSAVPQAGVSSVIYAAQ